MVLDKVQHIKKWEDRNPHLSSEYLISLGPIRSALSFRNPSAIFVGSSFLILRGRGHAKGTTQCTEPNQYCRQRN